MNAGELAREKLERLQAALVLETDAARKFRLEQEIEEAKAQVRAFGGDLKEDFQKQQSHEIVDKSVKLEKSEAGVVVTGDNSVIHVDTSQKLVLPFLLMGGFIFMGILIVVLILSLGEKSSDTTIQISGENGVNIKNSAGNVNFSHSAPSRPSLGKEEE